MKILPTIGGATTPVPTRKHLAPRPSKRRLGRYEANWVRGPDQTDKQANGESPKAYPRTEVKPSEPVNSGAFVDTLSVEPENLKALLDDIKAKRPEQLRVATLLEQCGCESLAERIRWCGTDIEIVERPDGTYWLACIEMRCHLPDLCPFCELFDARQQKCKQTDRLLATLKAHPELALYLITVTVRATKSCNKGLAHLALGQANMFRRGARSRANRYPKHSSMAPVHGGVAFTECPQSEGWWTPHSHWLVLCKSEPDEKMLGREWMKVMGDSFDVQVDRVSVFKKFGDRRDGLFWPELRTEVFRLAQYGTKPANRTPTGKIRFHFARRKTCDGKFRRAKRLVNSYGIVRGVKVVRPPKAKRRGLRFRCSTAGSNYKEVKPDPRDQVAGPSNCDAPKRGRR